MLSALLPLGLLGALAAAWWKWGCEGFGWVSLEQLEENLETVRKYVAEKLEELKGEMLHRFSSIGEMLTQCTKRVEQVTALSSTTLTSPHPSAEAHYTQRINKSGQRSSTSRKTLEVTR